MTARARLFLSHLPCGHTILRRGFAAGDALIFGPETRGLPDEVLDLCPPERRLRIPMLPGVRSLNLSNAVAVVVYEAWRQRNWEGGRG